MNSNESNLRSSNLETKAEEIAEEYDPEYWREKEENGEFAQGFWDELADAGFHGLLVPEEYGGSGKGMQEMGAIMETLCAEGCGMAGTWYLVLTAGMATAGIRRYGTTKQKEKYLPGIVSGERMFSIGITEPEAGTNTLNIATRAEQDRDEYVLNGTKTWITFADEADNIVLVTRTTPRENVDRGTGGISLFIVDLDDPGIEMSVIPKHGINYSNGCRISIDDVRVPAEDLLGEEDSGWGVLTTMLNPERIGFAAAGTGIGKLAAHTAVEYTNNREVFGRPVGSHQAVSFPITKAYAKMEAATLMRQKAARLYDNEQDCAYETNVAKATAVEAGIEAVKQSMQAFGGWGYAKENHIERWWREVNLTRLAPVTQQMAYNHISQQLGFPKSY